MTTTEYLFGKQKSYYAKMTFEDALQARYEDARILYNYLRKQEDDSIEHRLREHKVLNAMIWAKKRIDED